MPPATPAAPAVPSFFASLTLEEQTLYNMGLTKDISRIRQLLTKHRNDVNAVANELLE